MSDDIILDYDEGKRVAVLTFPNSKHQLKVSNVTREQATRFHEKHAAEFAKRDCCLETPAVNMTRDHRYDR